MLSTWSVIACAQAARKPTCLPCYQWFKGKWPEYLTDFVLFSLRSGKCRQNASQDVETLVMTNKIGT